MEIVHDFKVNATAEQLHSAIGTQEGIEGWWCKNCDIATEPGNVSEMRFDKQGTLVKMKFKVEKLNAGLISWTCVDNDNKIWVDTTIDFEISSKDGNSNLRFVHGNWDSSVQGSEGIEMIKQGWDNFMGSLKNYCETGTGQPW